MKGRLRRLHAAFFALLSVVYLWVCPYLLGMNNPNENTRVYLTMALVEGHGFAIDAMVRRHGWTNDMAKVPDGSPAGHHLASVKGPLVSYMGVPVYALQYTVARALGAGPPAESAPLPERQAWLRATTIVLQVACCHGPCLAFLWWLERRLRRFSRDVVLRLATVAAVGLGTNYLAYSLVFVSHALCSVAAFAAVDLLMAERERARRDGGDASPRVALLAGLAAGSLTLLEYQGAVLSVVLGVAGVLVLRRGRALAAFSAGAAVCIALLMIFQHGSFGHPLKPGQQMMETAQYGALYQQGFFGFSLPSREALTGLLLDGGYGFFGTSPFFWASIAGGVLLLVARPKMGEGLSRQLALSALLASLLTLTIASSNIWRGGWTIGPRYLGALPGLLAPLALVAFEALGARRRALARAIALGLSLASFVRAGAIGLVVSTLPESIARPMTQVLLPLVRLLFVPHHAGELVGLTSPWWFFVAPGAAIGAFVVAGAMGRRGAMRGVVSVAVALLVTAPAVHLPRGGGDAGPEVRAFFVRIWEPAGRDRLTEARALAQGDPCRWGDVERLEGVLGREAEVAAARRAKERCQR